MLATLGFAMIGTFMLLIMTRKMSAAVALLLIPILFGALAGFGPQLGKMVGEGITQVAPIGITLMFAVLYFGLMLDVGLFDPLTRAMVRRVGSDPLRIALGTTVVSTMVALDGDGTSTALVVIGAFWPIYQRIGMNPLILLTLLGLSNSIMNMTPWGGPVARAASALHLDPNDIFLPMLPTMGIGLLGVFGLAWHFGRRERRRLGYDAGAAPALSVPSTAAEVEGARGGGRWRRGANVLLTLLVLAMVLTRAMVRRVGNDPLRISLGTTLVSSVVALDGDGTSTALVVIGAFLPIYRRIGMNLMVLLTLLGLTNSIMNFTPWGGPVARAAGALHLDPNDIFLPLIPTMVIGSCGVLLLAWRFGVTERRRLGYVREQGMAPAPAPEPMAAGEHGAQAAAAPLAPTAPGRLRRYGNVALTFVLLGFVFTRAVPLSVAFMVGAALALLLNFSTPALQLARLEAHAQNCFFIILLIISAGAFTGIVNGSGMVDAMGQAMIGLIAPPAGPYMAIITALLSLPLTFLMSNDAYYFGVLPILAKTGAAYGVPAVEIARASLIGIPVHTLSPLVASLYLVTAMLKLEIGPVQRFAMKWAVLCSLLLLAGALLTGALTWPGARG